MEKIIIVKISSLGDVIQTFPVVSYIKSIFPKARISWVISPKLSSLINSYPLIDHTIEFSSKGLKELRKRKFDYLFDLQGNTKSALATFLARAKVKVGYGKKSVTEWPNLLVTNHKINLPKNQNISNFYVSLVQSFFKDKSDFYDHSEISLTISEKQKKKIDLITKGRLAPKIMVCPHSKWENKKLPSSTLFKFLDKLSKKYHPSFFFVSGSAQEMLENKKVGSMLNVSITYLEKLSMEVWQNLMREMDLVFAMDSSGLHLCATTCCPTYSVFGPTNAAVFKPLGDTHGAFEGVCPFNISFVKRCPKLRKCESGDCIKNIDPDELWLHFENWAKLQNIFKFI